MYARGFISLLAGAILSAISSAAAPLPLEHIRLPDGFTISLFADDLPNARSMALSSDGTLFVGTRSAGNVYALRDHNGDGKADKTWTIASGRNMPNGVAFRDGALYVAEVNRICRYDDIERRLDDPPEPVVLNDSFPTEAHHGWKYLAFGPDDKLYFGIGAPCNSCNREKTDPRFATLMRMNADGSSPEIYASGIRNTVGFAWSPTSRELWFTENGRDMMGDDLPPDELNHAPKPGLHFGYPYCHGNGIPDPQLNEGRVCDEFVAPARELGPHVAALGIKFYTGQQFPEAYRNQILIAEHGSWNRSTPIGYRIMFVRLDADQRVRSYEPFAEGWLQGGRAWGRPVDLLVMPDGALLVSDDHAGAIYRIVYTAH